MRRRIRHICLLLLMLCFKSLSIGQSQNSVLFEFIETQTDTTNLKFIRTFKCVGKKGDNIPSLYKAIKAQSTTSGANCFRFKIFSRDSLGKMTLTLNSYFANDSLLEINYNNHEKNAVYVFGSDKLNAETFSFQINKSKKNIKSGTYFKYIIAKDEKIKINKGGFSGTTVIIKWGEKNDCRYLTTSGFGLVDTPNYGSYGGGAGVSFTTGKIGYMDESLARLLTLILEPHKGL